MFVKLFYNVKPIIPRKLQLFLRRRISRYKRKKHHHLWPIDPATGTAPRGWQGWPASRSFALVLSHDVDTKKGLERVLDLLRIEKALGFKSAFNFVPERYKVPPALVAQVKAEGFEVGVHGLKHDGKLFKSRKIFNQRAQRINHYLKAWEARGFTAPSMICKLEWIHDLNISHSTSSFDSDPFEPVPNPVGTIFPFAVNHSATGHTFIELPYTLPQDHALFVILKERGIEIWQQKLDWIAACGGMALLNSHPDYMRFDSGTCGQEEYPLAHYESFLNYVRTAYQGRYWNALPSEMARFWRSKDKDKTAEGIKFRD
jgi:hypothetical protein